jgi:hypothetical protein
MSDQHKTTDPDVIVTIRLRPGYAGAQVTFPPREGEDWRRGRDLADGPLSEATLMRIMQDVQAVAEGFDNAWQRDRHE